MQALQGHDLTIFGDGQQTRSFCYVDDMIEAMLRLMESSSLFTGPVNIGNPQEITILELAEKILHLVGGKSKLIFLPLPSDDPRQRQPDISLAKSKLGWAPKVALDEGLQHTIAYFRSIGLSPSQNC
jgi:UDP-glucuronate decarboxylase